MYAFVSNEYRTIVHTQRQLDFLCSIYSYPKFKMVENVAEAKKFFNSNIREFFTPSLNQYGKVKDIGYISVQYFIDGNNIYLNVYTKHFGFIKMSDLPSNIKQDSSYDLLKMKICNINLDNSQISHHCVAITHILQIFGDYINIELILPDVSVYLACTKYKGRNFGIKRLQSMLNTRMGATFYTIRRS